MWNYEKRLEYPVNITTPNPKIAQIIMSQYGGPEFNTRWYARKASIYAGLRAFRDGKSRNKKVKIHRSRRFFIDDTIHDGAEQKSLLLGWLLWIFQNIINVFYLFPEIFFRDCFRLLPSS